MEASVVGMLVVMTAGVGVVTGVVMASIVGMRVVMVPGTVMAPGVGVIAGVAVASLAAPPGTPVLRALSD